MRTPILVLLSIVVAATVCRSNAGSAATQAFILRLHDHRVEGLDVPGLEPPALMTFESKVQLYGHLRSRSEPRRNEWVTYNDSIRFDGISPGRFRGFLSLDTLFAISTEDQNVTQQMSRSEFNTLLTCLFVGPAMRVRLGKRATLQHIDHMKAACPSGIYTRLDPPASLGIFLFEKPPARKNGAANWSEVRTCPSYAGTGISPRIRIAYASLASDGDSPAFTLSADTTLSELRVEMPNGETIDIISNHVTLGGEVWVTNGGLPRGEIRIEEDIRYLRPRIGSGVFRKACRYVLTLESP